MTKIERIKLNDEEVCLKKSRFGWRVVYPIKNVDGSINRKNLLFGGSYWNILKILLTIGFITVIILFYIHDLQLARTHCEDALFRLVP
jgi:hypothetical protein